MKLPILVSIRRLARLLTLGGLLASSLYGSSNAPATSVLGLYGSKENIDIVSDPERVEITMLRVKAPWFSKRMDKRRYSEVERAPLKLSEIVRLKELLMREDAYGWDILKSCYPTWSARAEFFRSNSRVTIDFCFECNILMISRDGRPFSGEDFDSIRPIVFEIFKNHFPQDEIIQQVEGFDREKKKSREAIEKARQEESKHEK